MEVIGSPLDSHKIPMMSLDEVKDFMGKYGRYPHAEEMIKAPTTWLPIKPDNPSKLTLHWFDNGAWRRTCNVRFVPWPEMFPND